MPIGVIIGLAVKHERWEPASQDKAEKNVENIAAQLQADGVRMIDHAAVLEYGLYAQLGSEPTPTREGEPAPEGWHDGGRATDTTL